MANRKKNGCIILCAELAAHHKMKWHFKEVVVVACIMHICAGGDLHRTNEKLHCLRCHANSARQK